MTNPIWSTNESRDDSPNFCMSDQSCLSWIFSHCFDIATYTNKMFQGGTPINEISNLSTKPLSNAWKYYNNCMNIQTIRQLCVRLIWRTLTDLFLKKHRAQTLPKLFPHTHTKNETTWKSPNSLAERKCNYHSLLRINRIPQIQHTQHLHETSYTFPPPPPQKKKKKKKKKKIKCLIRKHKS